MIIDYNRLVELVSYKNETNPVISLYLNVTPPRDFAAELNSMLHNARRHVENRFDKIQFKKVDKLFEKIEHHLRESAGRPERTRMVVVFADADGLWQQYLLPVSLPSQIVVEPDIYIRPLTVLLDEFDRYCVLIADSRKARIFSLYLGDLEEKPDVFIEDNVPDRVRANRSRIRATGNIQGGLGDENIRRHIENHIHQHLKNAAEQTFRFFKQKKFNRIIIGAPEDKILGQLKDHLHSYLKKRLAGIFHASPDDSDDHLAKKALEIAQDYERRHEQEVIGELFEKSGPQGMGVLGTDPVIDALQLGQVHTLIIDNEFKREGYKCLNDAMLSTYEDTCPLCGSRMEKTGDLADEMVEAALFQDAEIEHVFAEHEDFQNYRVGALLRFTLTP